MFVRLAIKQYVMLPGHAFCTDPGVFKAPGADECYGPEHRYSLHIFYQTDRSPDFNPNAHLFRSRERHLIIERQARDEDRRNDTIRTVSRSLTNLAIMSGALVAVPGSSSPPPPAAAAAAPTACSTGGSRTGGGRLSDAAGAMGQYVARNVRLMPAVPRMPNSCKNDIPDKIDMEWPGGAPFRSEWFMNAEEYGVFMNNFVTCGDNKDQVHWPKLMDMISSQYMAPVGGNDLYRATHPVEH